MWDRVASFAGEKLLPPLIDVVKVIVSVPTEVEAVKEELESIQAIIINGADGMTEVAEVRNTDYGIKTRVKQLRDAVFLIEDVIEDYTMNKEHEPPDPGCAALPCVALHFVEARILGLRILYGIRGIRSRLQQINSIQSSSSTSTGSQNVTWHSHQMNALDFKKADIVGFEAPRDELIDCMKKKKGKHIVICVVVGMGGQGKTTLAKIVYDKVIDKFDCHAWIRVSRVYTVQGLLIEMLSKFCEGNKEAPPEGIDEMDTQPLLDQVRKYLRGKRYIVIFDDVWNKYFWNEVKFALLDNKKRSRILITTRIRDVAEFCKQSSFVYIHKLQPLLPDESWELFCKKAFLNEPGKKCPIELRDISSSFVGKCNGLPLAIVSTGSLLATNRRTPPDWEKISETLMSEPSGIAYSLGLSYDDLPDNIKPCLLYLGIYPVKHVFEPRTIIKQWIAEGFVKSNSSGNTLEEVADQYLTELINRNLVEVSSFGIDGKAKGCTVHDVLHEVIRMKIDDLGFCKFLKDDDDVQLALSGMIRRLSITATVSNNLMVTNETSSHIQSLYIFRCEELPQGFVREIPKKYSRLKVLGFEHSPLSHVPENIGNLFRLRYLSFRGTNVESLPNSIGDLQFLETLDLRETRVRQMPKGFNKLRNLRHLLANHGSRHLNCNGIQMKEGVGNMVALQTLSQVETDCREELVTELERLRQLRLLGLIHVKREYGSALCSSINEMRHLEKLYIDAINSNEVIDLHSISHLPFLQKLRLRGKLESLPKWIPKLHNLVKLSLISSKLTVDLLKSLNGMPNLLFLSLDSAYEGQSLEFQDGGFKTLKKLSLTNLYSLSLILVGEGALPLLKELMLDNIPQLIEVPNGIHHLVKLEAFRTTNMQKEFTENIRKDEWINKIVSFW